MSVERTLAVNVGRARPGIASFIHVLPLPEKPVAQSLSSLRVRQCRSIVLQISHFRQAVRDAPPSCNPTTHSERVQQAATGSRLGPRKQKSCFITGAEKR